MIIVIIGYIWNSCLHFWYSGCLSLLFLLLWPDLGFVYIFVFILATISLHVAVDLMLETQKKSGMNSDKKSQEKQPREYKGNKKFLYLFQWDFCIFFQAISWWILRWTAILPKTAFCQTVENRFSSKCRNFSLKMKFWFKMPILLFGLQKLQLNPKLQLL